MASTHDTPGAAPRPLTESPALAARAADLLRTPGAMLQLAPEEAAAVAARMALVHYAAGATLLREGDQNAGHLLLLLEGSVEVDTAGPSGAPGSARADAVAVSVLGPGSIVGEMALLDGAPRSASCTARTPVTAAALSRRALQQLLDEQPRLAAKLLIGLAKRTADRLRALGDQLQMYAQLSARQQQELERLRAAPPR
ncbi:MAG: cyclic nucleotide-binding domain-containing protein [Rubrivivax sp.]|nr:cyclic nucleotide-binding domain-containing protein [Rubrivivax sp.]